MLRWRENCTSPQPEDDTWPLEVTEDKGEDVACGKLVHSSSLCLSVDDTADKFVDLSRVSVRELGA